MPTVFSGVTLATASADNGVNSTGFDQTVKKYYLVLIVRGRYYSGETELLTRFPKRAARHLN